MGMKQLHPLMFLPQAQAMHFGKVRIISYEHSASLCSVCSYPDIVDRNGRSCLFKAAFYFAEEIGCFLCDIYDMHC